jgi:chaperonin GroES
MVGYAQDSNPAKLHVNACTPTMRGMSQDESSKSKNRPKVLEVIEPVGKRVLIRKDEDRKQTRAGIHLPDKIEIPTITGRVVAISTQIERDEDYSLAKYDRVLFNPKQAIPVDLDSENRLFVIPVEDVVAIIRRENEKS